MAQSFIHFVAPTARNGYRANRATPAEPRCDRLIARSVRTEQVTLAVSSSGKNFVFVDEEEPAFVPMWREVFTGVDWLRLRADRVFYGLGVTRGNGAGVVTVPGFLGSDIYLREMNFWLRRIGYTARRSNIGLNMDCPDILADHLLQTVERTCDETGQPVHLIGHSLGGMLSRAVARFAPELIGSVITLGSPFRGIRSHPRVLRTGDFVRRRIEARQHERPAHKPMQDSCFSGACNCQFAEALRSGLPDSIPQTAVYTKTDGVVEWSVCITGDPTIDVEVRGTHCGLAFNAAVYRIISERLAAATEGAAQPVPTSSPAKHNLSPSPSQS